MDKLLGDEQMSDKIMTMLASVTGGKSYRAHKYGLDHAERPFIDYGEDSIIGKGQQKPIKQFDDMSP